MKTWSSYTPSDVQRGSAPGITVQEALQNAADAKRASTPQIVKSVQTLRVGGFVPSMIKSISKKRA
jgi:hypothetical protein